jgi:subtilisin family serine protease
MKIRRLISLVWRQVRLLPLLLLLAPLVLVLAACLHRPVQPSLRAVTPSTCTDLATPTDSRFSLDLEGDGHGVQVAVYKTSFKEPYLARWSRLPGTPAERGTSWAVANELLLDANERVEAKDLRATVLAALAKATPPAKDGVGIDAFLARHVALEHLPGGRAYLLRLDSLDSKLDSLIRSGWLLRQLPYLRGKLVDIARVEPNPIYTGLASPSCPDDPYYSLQSNLLDQINARVPWTAGETGKGSVTVAVLDTGMQCQHEDLVHNVLQNGGADFYGPGNNYCDGSVHGTECAGIIGAEGCNHKGIAGVNWHVSIMPVKFMSPDACGSCADAQGAVNFAAQQGAPILSASWGGSESCTALRDTIAKAGLFVTAAGNDGRDIDQPNQQFYPASFKLPNILVVGATKNDPPMLAYSWGATTVHLSAPGVFAVSTCPPGAASGCPLVSGYCCSLNGTSISTAFTAGAAALLLAHDGSLGTLELKKRLIDTARPARQLNGRSCSSGILDLARAFNNDTTFSLSQCP